MKKTAINGIATTLIIIAATLGLAMAGGLVKWQEVASLFKGDDTAKTTEAKTKMEAADPSHGATYAHTTVFSGMPFALSVEGCSVSGEAGSLAEAAELSLSALDSVPPMAAGMVNVTRGAAGYRLSPSGMGFSKPVRVELGYDSLLLPKGHSAKEIRTFLYDPDNRRWEALPMDSVMEGAQKTGAQTTKAGELVNAIVQLPELPESKAFTPTMLTELEAAHPATGVTMMEPPAANSQGTANLSYPITVPAGRNGLQPNLSVSYSSEAGNGLLGMGWDMQLPAITVDSRWGVPRYDTAYETECYLLNGQELLPSPHYLAAWEARNQAEKVFYPRTETSFDSITRKGTAPGNYFWEVRDKSGKKYYYGSYDGERPQDSVLLKDTRGNIAYWPLCRVEDMDGNLVMYYYHVEQQYSGTTYLGKQLWLESIRYTGNAKTGDTGIYTVYFSGEHCTETIRTRGDEITPPEDDCQCPDMFLQIHKTVAGLQEPLHGIRFELRDNTTGSGNTYITDHNGDIIIPISGCNHEFTLNEMYHSGYCNILRDFQFRIVQEGKNNCRFEIINHGNQPETVNINNDSPNSLELDIENIPCGGGSGTGDSIYSARPHLPDNVYAYMSPCDCEEEYPEDLRTDARWGFLHSGKNKLRRIVVYSGDSLVRSYSFCYDADVFGRAQLQKIRQWNADCSGESWDHEFSYYDDIAGNCLINNNGETVMDSVSVSGQRERIKNVAALRPIMSSAVTYPGKLSSNRTWSIGMGGGANVGIGGNTMSKDMSIAYSMQASMDYGKGLTTLQDVTGDGLPDMVYHQHGNTYYRPQMRNANGVFFGPEEELAGVKNFLKSRTFSISHGPSINAIVHGGLNFTHSKQTTSTYFSDMDGDGRLDIVHDGKVNSIVPRYEAPVLTMDSSCTVPSLTKGNALPAIGEINLPEDMYYEEEKEEEDFPHYDLVRVWRVPVTAAGEMKYKIYAPAFLLEDSTVQTSNDTILLSMEYMDSDTHYLIALGELMHGDTLWSDTLRSFSLKKSGVLFFRARTANSTATGQLLNWDPQVLYYKTFTDAYGQMQPYADKASDKQLLISDGLFTCPFKGRLHLLSNDTVGPFIDSVSYTLCKNNVELYRFTGCKGGVNLLIDTAFTVNENDLLSFKAEASSQVDFSHNQWHPYIYYEYVSDPSFSTGDTLIQIQTDTLSTSPLETDTIHLLSFYPLPFYKAYNRLVSIGEFSNSPYTNSLHPNQPYTLCIEKHIQSTAFGHLKMVFKTKDSVLYTEEINMDTTNINSDIVYCHIFSNIVNNVVDSVYAECYLSDSGMETWINKVNIFSGTSMLSGFITPVVYAADEWHLLYGSMHGGWGQFQYLHDTCSLMDTAKLNYLQSHYGTMSSTYLQQNLTMAPDSNSTISSYNTNDSTALFLSTGEWFSCLPLTGDGARGCWSGLYPESYINGAHINLGFRPFTDIEEENEERSETPSSKTQKILSSKSTRGQQAATSRLDKVSKSRNFSLTYGAMIIGGSESSLSNHIVRDVMDLNGDGYPDFINENNVCYSRHGGLNWDFNTPKTMNTGFYGSSSHTTNDVFTATVMQLLDKVSHNANPNHTVSDYTGISQTSVIDETEYMLLDINGDGLPDLIYSDGMVQLNSGYAFDIVQHWEGLDNIGIYESKTFSANANAPAFPLADKKISKVCQWKASISGGIGFTLAKNEHIITLADLNGDGLPDLVHKNYNGSIRYRLNTGCGFENVWRQWLMSVPVAWSTSASVNADVAVTGGFTFMSVFKVGGSVTARGGYSATSEYAQIADFDGDGLPDMLSINNDDNLYVRYARLGRTGLLKTVTNPLGGSIMLDYEMTDANVYHPRRWVMKEVKLSDNLSGDGADTLTTRYGYQYGYYDHAERRFSGFAKVSTFEINTNGDTLRTTERYFANNNVHLAGQILAEVLYDSLHRRYVQTTNQISLDTLNTIGGAARVFPKLTRRQTCYFEGLSQAPVTKIQTFEYENHYGNLVRQSESSTDQAKITANIFYHAQYNGNYCVNRVSRVDLRNGANVLLRRRTTDLDAMGHITAIHDYFDSTHCLTTRMEYNAYGNIVALRSPNTTTCFAYDSIANTYPTAVTDTFGIASYMQDYDYRFGVPGTIVDRAGNRMEYTLDAWGRTLTIRGPKEIAANLPYTIRHSYFGKDSLKAYASSLTEHYDQQHPGNSIKVRTYCDGLGRIVQTRKEAAVNGVEKQVVSGLQQYDALGRAVKTYYPTEAALSDTACAFVTGSIPPATVVYDVLDRPLLQTAPDGSSSTFLYGFDGSHLGKMLFKTTSTDANHHSSTELKDVNGQPWAIKAAGQPFVYFDYNAAGDNTRVYSSIANDWERIYTYDLLGRKLTYTEGELWDSYTYNGMNLSSHRQRWQESGQIRNKTTLYHYNAHRLDSVTYDDAISTVYHYNAYGQPDSVYDESGVMCYTYGNMGEVTQETRIYALPFLSQPIALTTQFTYDSWGRILNITYPDNEIVNYDYDLGGQLERMYNNSSYTYLDNIIYDKFGAKTSQDYGNGIVTQYTYNDTTRRLSEIATNNGALINYTYDLVGNVTQVTSVCPWLQNQSFTENFSYDSTDQLTAAQESQNNGYQLVVNYDNWGKIMQYDLTQTDMLNNATSQISRSLTYPSHANNVGNSQTPFAPTMQNGDEDVFFTFGINGSLRKREVQTSNPHTEYYLFNSQGNLKAYSDDAISFAYYGYNAANTRTYKISLNNTNVWINGQPQALHMQLQQAMFYPNTYLNFDAFGNYTKHYYNGMERIASRLGENNIFIAIADNACLESRRQQAEEQFRNDIQDLISELAQIDMPAVADALSLQGMGTPNDVFYYHINHLGNTAFVTDQNQTITQGFLYAPFGEITTEYNVNFGNNTIPKYAFNAKELDEETGMYYYEARYYNPPVFTSRDPLFEKYPTFSPYTYCMSNPVKYVDPDGKSGVPVIDKEKKIITIYSKLYFYGSAANSELSKKIATGIASQWNGANAKYEIDGVEYSVKFRISYETVSVKRAKELAKNNTDPKNNFIRVARGPKGKSSFTLGKGNSFWFNVNDDLENSTTPSHEFGHGLGLSHPIVDLSETTERPDIMVPRNKRYGIYWSIKNSAGVRVVNPNSRRVTEKNVKEAILKGCGQVNNIIINDDGTY